MRECAIIFFCTWKFAATFPIAIYAMNMSAIETFIYSNIGGVIGAIFFFYFWKKLIALWIKYMPDKFVFKKKKRRVISKSTRRMVRLKNKYGLPGIAILSPVILSIPVGAFVAAKYYGRKKSTMIWLITWQVIWSIIYIYSYMKIKMLV